MLISYLLPVAAGGQQVAVGSPTVAPVLEEVGKHQSTKLKQEGGKEAKPRLCNLPNDKQGRRRDVPVTTAPLAS